MPLLEGVGDVLQEDQPEHDVLVLGGVHVAAELVGRRPELLLEAELGTAVRLLALLAHHANAGSCAPSAGSRIMSMRLIGPARTCWP